MDFKEIGIKVGIGLIRLRIGIIGGPLWMRHWISEFHKPWSWLVKALFCKAVHVLQNTLETPIISSYIAISYYQCKLILVMWVCITMYKVKPISGLFCKQPSVDMLIYWIISNNNNNNNNDRFNAWLLTMMTRFDTRHFNNFKCVFCLERDPIGTTGQLLFRALIFS